ncbi:hypothetical protein D0Z07_1111 [Hyphodiscus hymeniophilus]|uniref:Uncharacterized protein n=1 Tax=Hyphodiscus hymeniophilus TaxID=353542 RepID=A0A9P7AZN3_9HELO|nr:hypothetical protein D0Z07_1111 [Hyphodiscus hymeniophilus]
MASLLTNANDSGLNSANSSLNRDDDFDVEFSTQSTTVIDSDGLPSSPFVANVSDAPNYENDENISPSKQLSRMTAKSPIDREPTSPLKMLKSRTSPIKGQSPQKVLKSSMSPRKLSSPEKRFPVKVSLSPEKQSAVEERTITMDDVLRDNEGLTRAIKILEDEDSELSHEEHVSDDTLTSPNGDEAPNMDDTMVSTFSAFSAVPDMTMFARLGQSPTKYSMHPTPRPNTINTPATARRPRQNRSPSPTPRGHRNGGSRDDGNTTNLILDFTDQISGFSGRLNQSPAKLARQSPYKNSTMPDMGWGSTATPASNRMSNLLDFDIPPAPTPRSMPSITPRELESLKSGFLSEISSLKASLSGKEAEVQSLKTAVGDAEKRVGESMEQIREERNLKEQLAAEKEEWEKRGREMEAVLRNVKEEIVHGEHDREDLEGQLDESERRREAAEMMAQEAESKMAGMKASKVSTTSESDSKIDECSCGGKAVELAVEKVSRELHTLYKEKHETKVSALKKSYERRWDKRVKELESQVDDLSKENEELKLGRDTTMTKVEPKNPVEVTEDLEIEAAKDAKAAQLEARLEGLAQEVRSVKQDNSELRTLLDEERVEKGKLVQAVDEMIPLVVAFDEMLADMDSAPQVVANISPQKQSQPSTIENLRGSISRASGLRAPASISGIQPGESRIGRGGFGAPAGHERSRSGSSSQGLPRPGSGLGARSGIMSSIEKMGSYRGRGE